MEQSKPDYDALGQVIDTTWGRSSTSTPLNGSVKTRMQGTMLLMTYGVQTNTNARYGMPHVKQNCAAEALSIINKEIARIKSDYKDLTGNSIKISQIDANDNIETIVTSSSSACKTVLYRMSVLLEVM